MMQISTPAASASSQQPAPPLFPLLRVHLGSISSRASFACLVVVVVPLVGSTRSSIRSSYPAPPGIARDSQPSSAASLSAGGKLKLWRLAVIILWATFYSGSRHVRSSISLYSTSTCNVMDLASILLAFNTKPQQGSFCYDLKCCGGMFLRVGSRS